ncbi:MAG TPA: YkgJ family cysteine cluster protein [Terracidiphilus sp.]
MSGNPETQTPADGTVHFALRILGAKIEVRAPLPEGPVSPRVLLPILRGLSDSIGGLAVTTATTMGKHLSCREGCGACCRQPVPITPVEARAIAEWIEQQPMERQAALRERFRQAAARLEQSGIAEGFRRSGSRENGASLHELGLRYFELGIPCPFLEEERCTIHEIRPLRCREYLVVSPAENCAQPRSKEIVGIKPPVLLSRFLETWDANGDPQPRGFVLLTLLDEWLAEHPAIADRPHRTSPELLQEFLHAFARDADAAPADHRAGAAQMGRA